MLRVEIAYSSLFTRIGALGLTIHRIKKRGSPYSFATLLFNRFAKYYVV